jgi:hypothetical protein
MNFGETSAIRADGFQGFVTISDLQQSQCRNVPTNPGVYLVLNSNSCCPGFLEKNIGGHFKEKDPTTKLCDLEKKWVDGAVVLYIGKAGGGKATLRKRLHQYMRFGGGKKIGHWGGRYIWQLARSCDLLVVWKTMTLPDADPRREEQLLLVEFTKQYGKLPFANLVN